MTNLVKCYLKLWQVLYRILVDCLCHVILLDFKISCIWVIDYISLLILISHIGHFFVFYSNCIRYSVHFHISSTHFAIEIVLLLLIVFCLIALFFMLHLIMIRGRCVSRFYKRHRNVYFYAPEIFFGGI